MSLELITQEARTKDGLWVITYAYPELPLDQQEAAFAAAGLETISPAQVGYFRHAIAGDNPFVKYSRTNMEVFYDTRDAKLKVVLLSGSPLKRLVGNLALTKAHRNGTDFVIPKKQRGIVYDLVDTTTKASRAFVTTGGVYEIPTSDFDKHDITCFMYTDDRLGAKPQNFGDWLNGKGRKTHYISLDNQGYALRQSGLPFLTRLCLHCWCNDFNAGGDYGTFDCDEGAFGMSIGSAEAKR